MKEQAFCSIASGFVTFSGGGTEGKFVKKRSDAFSLLHGCAVCVAQKGQSCVAG